MTTVFQVFEHYYFIIFLFIFFYILSACCLVSTPHCRLKLDSAAQSSRCAEGAALYLAATEITAPWHHTALCSPEDIEC